MDTLISALAYNSKIARNKQEISLKNAEKRYRADVDNINLRLSGIDNKLVDLNNGQNIINNNRKNDIEVSGRQFNTLNEKIDDMKKNQEGENVKRRESLKDLGNKLDNIASKLNSIENDRGLQNAERQNEAEQISQKLKTLFDKYNKFEDELVSFKTEYQNTYNAITERIDSLSDKITGLSDLYKSYGEQSHALLNDLVEQNKQNAMFNDKIGSFSDILKVICERECDIINNSKTANISLQEILSALRGLDEGIRLLIAKTLLASMDV